MTTNEIKFITSKQYIECTEVLPEPSKLNIPSWYKELNHSVNIKTVKGCMPFLDTLTTGYTLKMPVDYFITHNIKKEGERYTKGYTELDYQKTININSKDNLQVHPIDQLGKKCPFVNKNKNLPFNKLLNPWIIKTPPGYSCLFTPPLNNKDDRFEIISGIVDTDSYETEINFPIVINGDKYPVLNEVIKKGTPYVQIIPFKRESWKMKIHSKTPGLKLNQLSFYTELINKYKTLNWSKKSWK
jgi:hypothetical protein